MTGQVQPSRMFDLINVGSFFIYDQFYKIIRKKHQNRACCHLYCTACGLVLLSHFNIANLFNDHIYLVPWLLTDCTENEQTGLFFLTFCCIITPVSGIIGHYCVMENLLKNREKIRTN